MAKPILSMYANRFKGTQTSFKAGLILMRCKMSCYGRGFTRQYGSVFMRCKCACFGVYDCFFPGDMIPSNKPDSVAFTQGKNSVEAQNQRGGAYVRRVKRVERSFSKKNQTKPALNMISISIGVIHINKNVTVTVLHLNPRIHIQRNGAVSKPPANNLRNRERLLCPLHTVSELLVSGDPLILCLLIRIWFTNESLISCRVLVNYSVLIKAIEIQK